MMFLSRMYIDPARHSVMRALINRSQFHGAIESAFIGERQHPLWRIDTFGGKTYLMILSRDKPDLSSASEQFGTDQRQWESKDYAPLLDRVKNGTSWQFCLTANPTYSTPNLNGERGTVHAHTTPQNQCKWLENQAARHGFSVQPDQFNVVKDEWLQFYKGNDNNRRITILSVTYRGILTVTDEILFREALCEGIGRGKAYGQGLMTLVSCHG